MPPQRTPTLPTPAKPLKTERTHEENQERAYIAASRRSDRSLEARVESARRASEIHKRRTGRSLRVTEQDVVNEEMYEEEDDDLPFQYRRLTAHLQTGSADFNRRLAAYLTNHVAMRTALDQAISASYAQQFPNAPPRFPHDSVAAAGGAGAGASAWFPSPMLPAPTAAVLPPVSTPAPPPAASPTAASPCRQSPYPMPGAAAFRQRTQPRHPAVNGDGEELLRANPVDPRRPCVASTDPLAPSRGGPTSAPAVPSTVAEIKPADHPRSGLGPGPAPAPAASADVPAMAPAVVPSQALTPSFFDPAFYGGGDGGELGPLSLSLPTESQLLLGPSLDPTDPLTSMFMVGSDAFPQPAWSASSGFPAWEGARTSMASTATAAPPGWKAYQPLPHSYYDGMYATLAPSALELSASTAGGGGAPMASSATTESVFRLKDEVTGPRKPTAAASGRVAPPSPPTSHAPTDSFLVSRVNTPDLDDWPSAFINDILWE
ncbi:MAG: hypothetical protein M1826_005114 [Phylliscum demangeonii]|nr:MAG: hypothetical protein M1826_005114 [Phylliscum demangeonii]